DKTEGKGLSTEDYTAEEKAKLTDIEEKANKYTHPATHSINIITETTTKKVMTAEERDKLAEIEAGANKYIHPDTHPASMIEESITKRFVSDNEKLAWDAKETPEGAQA